MPNSFDRTSAMLMGALVADAATLGLHWIYDVDRIASIVGARGEAAFTPVDAANYDGGVGYFAHGARANGDLTQYGACLRLTMQSILKTQGVFDADHYSSAFAAHFGAGGAFQGYIDRPTRGALNNIAAEQSPSGIDDDQLPALSTLPAILAARGGADARIAAMQVTNVNPVADLCSALFADLLKRLLAGEDLQTALTVVADAAPDGDIRDTIQAALASNDTDSVAYGAITQRACHLPMAAPLIFHILKHASSFADAVDRNIRAGGDNAGRSIMIGAAMGARYGIATPKGLPLDWVLKTSHADALWAESCAFKET